MKDIDRVNNQNPFLPRVVGVWNVLPRLLVEADTIMVFKRLIDRHMNIWNGGIWLAYS